MPQFRRSYIASAGRRNLLRDGSPSEGGIGDGMTFETAMAGRSPPRRRIGWLDKAALLCGALACACGAAAWISESLSFASPVASPMAHELLSFEERFAQVAVPQSLRGRTLQPLDRSALSALETKVQDARGVLAERLQLGEWRGALL